VRLSLWRATRAWKRTACGARSARPCRASRSARTYFAGTAREPKRAYSRRFVTLRIDRRVGRRWKVVSQRRVRTGSGGGFRYSAKLAPGTFRVRAGTTGTAAYRAATSAFRYVVVPRARHG
jgi:hypothetical protein